MGIKYAYSFAPKARTDLEDVLRYIEEELSNPKAAVDMAKTFFEKIDTLRASPLSGRKIDNEYVLDQNLRKFFVGKYIVFYKPDEDNRTIIIVRIIYGGRNVDDILKTMR